MTTFRIMVNGEEDVIKAKHIKDGYYHCKRLKTGNKFQIKWIGTMHSDKGITYNISQLYQTSPLYYQPATAAKVIKCNY